MCNFCKLKVTYIKLYSICLLVISLLESQVHEGSVLLMLTS